jgi:cardiolipin synthase C
MRAILTLILCTTACASTIRDRLLYGDLKPDMDYCKAMSPTPRPGLSGELASFESKMKTMTGTWVLEDGAGAMVSRAWLAENAEHTIDVQYFIFSSDNVGLIAVDYLVRAAERGIKVRLMIDDLLYDADAYLLQALDAHPNLEIRVYNPNLTTGKNLPSALANAAFDFRGANQRMHNKTFIVDGKAVITGGRNVADEYFDFNLEYNFRDRDVLLLGEVVSQVSKSFEEFWKDELAAPVSTLMGKADPKESEQLWSNLRNYACAPQNFWPVVRERIQRVPEAFRKLAASGQLQWVDNVAFVSDEPGKNPGKEGLGGGGASTTKLIELVQAAKKSIVIQTPYLITTELGEGLFKAAIKRGVQVTILTNSLATTDGLAAFHGYQRVRPKLIAAGVQLYEFRPDAKIRRKLLSSSVMKAVKNLPIFGLHAKTMVVDDELLVVGTFNLDPRSANLNTECVVLIPSPELAKGVLDTLTEEAKPENSYKVTRDENGDQYAPFGLRLKAWFAGIVPASIL